MIERQPESKKVIEELQNNSIICLITSAKEHSTSNIELLDYLINEKKMRGIYVCLNKPHNIIIKILGEYSIDSSNIFFVDCVSLHETRYVENCKCIESPSALTEISINIDKIIEEDAGYGFVLFDSVSTLFIYNDAKSISRFIKNLTYKLKKSGLLGIFLMIEDKSKLEQLMQCFDKVVSV